MIFPDDNNAYYIGGFIKQLRELIGITQQDVSDEVGYSIQTISKFENGKSNPLAYASRKISEYVITLAELEEKDVYELYKEYCACMEDMKSRGFRINQ